MDLHKAGAIACSVLSIAMRVCGIVLCIFTIMLCFPGLIARLKLVDLVFDLAAALPAVISGYGLIPSPMGGVFRFDFALCAAFFFLIDYVLQRVSRSLR